MGQLKFDLGAVRRNYRFLQEKVGAACTVSAMVKANAYGCGAVPMARALHTAGARQFFVATLEEAVALREALSPPVDVFMLNGFRAAAAETYVAHAITPVLNAMGDIADYAALANRLGRTLHAVLHCDTGMNRLGVDAADVTALRDKPALWDGITLRYVMSHLACADERDHPMNPAQRERFEDMATHFPNVPRSLANSSGVFLSEKYHFDMIRPGMALYGLNPTPFAPNPMSPVVRLDVPLLQIKTARKGETCGYGASYVFEKDTRLGIVALGYADGFLRSLSNTGRVFWQGIACPVRGRVSMDALIVDLRNVAESAMPRAGDYVEVIGDHQSVDDLATAAGTLGYEILTALGDRHKRVYLDKPDNG